MAAKRIVDARNGKNGIRICLRDICHFLGKLNARLRIVAGVNTYVNILIVPSQDWLSGPDLRRKKSNEPKMIQKR